jgi:hypothetical protein
VPASSKPFRWILAVVAAATVLVIVATVAFVVRSTKRVPAPSPSALVSAAAPSPSSSAEPSLPPPKNDPRGREAARGKLVTPGKRLTGKPTALPETATVPAGLEPRQRFGDFAAEAVRLHLRPGLAPCVAALRQRTSTTGSAMVVFDLVARPDVGAILDEVEVERGSGPADALMERCVRENLSALIYAPPVPEGQGIFAFAVDVR